jgi:hypothetical protein
MVFAHLILVASWCSEPTAGLAVLRLSSGAACFPTWLVPSLSDGWFRAASQASPIVALHSPLKEGLTLVGDCPCAGIEASKAIGKKPTIEGPKAAISQERGMGSSPAASPLFAGVASDGLTMVTLPPWGGFGVGRGFLHLAAPHELRQGSVHGG